MKKISVMIPCYNEVENVVPISEAVVRVMTEQLPQYDYEILFIDNCSNDGTRDKIEEICGKNKKIRAIFNVTNFGQFNSPFYGMCQTSGDCTVSLCCDFQDPPEMIPVFVEKWEQGHKIVSGIKTSSRESRFMYTLRTFYYKMMRHFSDVRMIEHFTGFGLYDKTFISLLKELDDPIPFVRGIVAEYGSGFNMIEVEYEQPRRRAGKTHNNFLSLYHLLHENGTAGRDPARLPLLCRQPAYRPGLSDPEALQMEQFPGGLRSDDPGNLCA